MVWSVRASGVTSEDMVGWSEHAFRRRGMHTSTSRRDADHGGEKQRSGLRRRAKVIGGQVLDRKHTHRTELFSVSPHQDGLNPSHSMNVAEDAPRQAS